MAQGWVGGDIEGIADMGTALGRAPETMKGVIRALSTDVEGLVGHAGWKGEAAESFEKAWTADSLTAGVLSEVAGNVAGILTTLATELQKAESALHEAAAVAKDVGAPVGPEGVPGSLTFIGPLGGELPEKDKKALAALQTYSAEYDDAMQAAQGFRLVAEEGLQKVFEVASDEGASPSSAEWITMGDYLKGLYVVPHEANSQAAKALPGRIQKLHDDMKRARADYKAARAAYQRRGMNLPKSDPANIEHGRVADTIKDLKTDLAAAEAHSGELPLSKPLNYKLGDAAELARAGRFAELPKFLEFTKEIPVIDIAASAFVAQVQVKDDIEKGWSPAHAVGVDYGAAATGLVAGVGTASAIALSPLELPVAAVTLLAGGMVVGVGDFAYQAFHEHWSEDIHEDGVVKGVLDGMGHSGARVGDDVGKMVTGVKHAGKHLWHSVFG